MNENNFKCPYCKKEIDYKEINKRFGAQGGRNSKRKLTKEESAMMLAAREAKKKKKKT